MRYVSGVGGLEGYLNPCLLSLLILGFLALTWTTLGCCTYLSVPICVGLSRIFVVVHSQIGSVMQVFSPTACSGCKVMTVAKLVTLSALELRDVSSWLCDL